MCECNIYQPEINFGYLVSCQRWQDDYVYNWRWLMSCTSAHLSTVIPINLRWSIQTLCTDTEHSLMIQTTWKKGHWVSGRSITMDSVVWWMHRDLDAWQHNATKSKITPITVLSSSQWNMITYTKWWYVSEPRPFIKPVVHEIHLKERKEGNVYLTTHSTYFIYGYRASEIIYGKEPHR